MAKIVRSDFFKSDFIEISTYIGADSIDSALRFMDSVEETTIRLSKMPEMAPKFPFEKQQLQDIRFFPVTGFANHLIFYRPIEDGINVLRLIHGARDIPALF